MNCLAVVFKYIVLHIHQKLGILLVYEFACGLTLCMHVFIERSKSRIRKAAALWRKISNFKLYRMVLGVYFSYIIMLYKFVLRKLVIL